MPGLICFLRSLWRMRQFRQPSVTQNVGVRWWMGPGKKMKRIWTEQSAKAKARNQEMHTVCPKMEEQWLKTLSEWEFPSAALKYTSRRNCTLLDTQFEKNYNKKIVESRSNVNVLSYVQKSLKKHALCLYEGPTLFIFPTKQLPINTLLNDCSVLSKQKILLRFLKHAAIQK